ncbi:DUF2284 domain-containing protein [Desulfothermus okinawensis JCM 13304]
MDSSSVKIVFEEEISTGKIVVSPRPVWKCVSCPMHGARPTCPPFVPSWKEARNWVKSYSTAILIKFLVSRENFEQDKRNIIHYLLHREKELFSMGNPYSFSLFPGSCNLCVNCAFEINQRCLMPGKIRPSVDAIGIELASITSIDFTESVLYSLIFKS